MINLGIDEKEKHIASNKLSIYFEIYFTSPQYVSINESAYYPTMDGDLYYKTQYAEHNLDRTRTQLKLVADMEAKWDEMNAFVKKYS